jgi:hypothetical protein
MVNPTDNVVDMHGNRLPVADPDEAVTGEARINSHNSAVAS